MDSADFNFQISPDFFLPQITCPIVRRNGKKGPQSLHFFKNNLRLECKVLDPRPYLLAMGGACDREELARITWENHVALAMGNTITHYHGLASCCLKTPWKRVQFHLSIPFPRPRINFQTHPNSSNHVQS